MTEADRASEALIKQRLADAFPEHGIYGEEGTRERLGGEYRWYVDPLMERRTSRTASRCSVLCWSGAAAAGLAEDADGEMVAGVIYDPLRDESFVAERGRGGVVEWAAHGGVENRDVAGGADGHGLSFAQTASLAERAFVPGGDAAVAWGQAGGVGGARSGVCGVRRLDGYWEFNLNPWDTSAGYLLVEEAGGTVTHFDGGKFTLDSREVMATNGKIFGEMRGCSRICSRDGM